MTAPVIATRSTRGQRLVDSNLLGINPFASVSVIADQIANPILKTSEQSNAGRKEKDA